MINQRFNELKRVLEKINKEKNKLDTYVASLDNKIDQLLEKQLYQFLKAQKLIFDRINGQTNNYLEKMIELEKIIQTLLDSGELSRLNRENQEIKQKLYQTTEKLIQQNKFQTNLKREIEVLKSENLKLGNSLKLAKVQMRKNKIQNCLKDEDSTLFITSNDYQSIKSLMPVEQNNQKIKILQNQIQLHKKKNTKLQKQYEVLENKYKRQLSTSITMMSGKTEYQKFFIESIEKFRSFNKKIRNTNTNFSSERFRQQLQKKQKLDNLLLNDRIEIFNLFLENDKLVSDLIKMIFGQQRKGFAKSPQLLQSQRNTINYDLPFLDLKNRKSKIPPI